MSYMKMESKSGGRATFEEGLGDNIGMTIRIGENTIFLDSIDLRKLKEYLKL